MTSSEYRLTTSALKRAGEAATFASQQHSQTIIIIQVLTVLMSRTVSIKIRKLNISIP